MAEKKEKKGKSKFIIFGALALIVLGVGSFAGFYFYNKSNTPQEPKPIVQAYQDLGEIMVNLDSEGRQRYLKVKLSVGFDSEEKGAAELLTNNTVVLRDSAIFYLKARKVDDFKAGNEKEIKKGLKEAFNSKLEDPLVLDVYMSDIIVQ